MQVGCGVVIHARGDGRGHYGEPAHLLRFSRAVAPVSYTHLTLPTILLV